MKKEDIRRNNLYQSLSDCGQETSNDARCDKTLEARCPSRPKNGGKKANT
jgi:hypothetical protein